MPGEEKEQEIRNLFEKIVKENVPNLVKEIDMKVQEAERVQNKIDAKWATLRHIIIKMPKVKDKENLSSQRKKQRAAYNEVPIRLPADFSEVTLQARRDLQEAGT